jgi:hypothetical protein
VLNIHQNKLVSGLHRPDSQPRRDTGEASLWLFHDLLNKVGAQSVITNDVVAARWEKVLWYVLSDFWRCKPHFILNIVSRNAAISSMCTATRSPVSDLLSSEVLASMLPVLETLMKEVCLTF